MLRRDDIGYIPVVTIEMHGSLPTDCEYLGPQAFAQKMAEETDGLILGLFLPRRDHGRPFHGLPAHFSGRTSAARST